MDAEVTADQAEVTADQAEVTAYQPEVTAALAEVTADQTEVTECAFEVTVNTEVENMDAFLSDHNYVSITKVTPTVLTKAQKKAIIAAPSIHKCEVCGFTAKRRGVMIKHRKKHKKVQKKEPISSAKESKTEIAVPKGQIKCKHCDFIAKTKHSMSFHMKIHLQTKSIKCMDCKFYGKDIADLIRHQKNGHDDMLTWYHCEECRYHTPYKDRLVIHKRSHSKVKPFACEVCSYSAKQKQSLLKHMKKHTVAHIDMDYNSYSLTHVYVQSSS